MDTHANINNVFKSWRVLTAALLVLSQTLGKYVYYEKGVILRGEIKHRLHQLLLLCYRQIYMYLLCKGIAN
jgi:hypothetical protein